MKTFNSILLFILFACITFNCSVRAPEVTVTGEKTALENQVIGTYELIEGDTWMIASTRGSTQSKSERLSVDKREVLEATQNRKFNKDDIDEFKRDGVLGENSSGFLEIRETERYRSDEKYKKIVDEILAEENRDREIIYTRVLQVNEAAAEAGQDKVYEIFARLNHDTSEPGTWLQLPDGTWVKKAKAMK
jgi:uncharacterized protein YdbL (DUF1318 family)